MNRSKPSKPAGKRGKKEAKKPLPEYAVAIVTARKERGLTQVQVAEKVDAAIGTVAGWETGAHGVSRKHREAVSKLLDIPLLVLVA